MFQMRGVHVYPCECVCMYVDFQTVPTVVQKEIIYEQQRIHFCNSDNGSKHSLVQEMQDDFQMNASRVISLLDQMLIGIKKLRFSKTIQREV